MTTPIRKCTGLRVVVDIDPSQSHHSAHKIVQAVAQVARLGLSTLAYLGTRVEQDTVALCPYCEQTWEPDKHGNNACCNKHCDEWETKNFKTFMDGNSWCATRHDFINLQESTAGFGPSSSEAIDDLLKNESARKS